jgi:RHS repeat-associated protein
VNSSDSSYYRARYYDAQAGRFLSEDPLLWNGGNGANFYPYAANSPVIHLDPSGKNIAVIGDVGSYGQAVAYLGQAPGMAAMLQNLRTSSALVQIKTNNNCKVDFDPDSLTINWDPTCTLYCSKSHCWISPALGLGHELIHAFNRLNDKGYADRKNTVVPEFDNAEEQFTIMGPENNAAIALGECLRSSHSGTFGRVATPVTRP